LVEQNVGFVLAVADIIYVMSKGRIVFSGTPEELRGRNDIETSYLGIGKSDENI